MLVFADAAAGKSDELLGTYLLEGYRIKDRLVSDSHVLRLMARSRREGRIVV